MILTQVMHEPTDRPTVAKPNHDSFLRQSSTSSRFCHGHTACCPRSLSPSVYWKVWQRMAAFHLR
jgi:hypothetical protein